MDFTPVALLDAFARSEPVVQSTIRRPIEAPPIGFEANFGGDRSRFTAIEAPYRLILSPNLESRWEHATEAVTNKTGDRTELWHTRLIKTVATPNLDLPANSDIQGLKENAFWPRVLDQDFLFHVVATDWDGREIDFLMPLAFVAKTVANNATQMQSLVDEYNKLKENHARRLRSLGGQKLAFAPAKLPNDTTLKTCGLIFGAMSSNATPRFLPMMHKAQVSVPAVQHITGQNTLSTIALDEKFLAGAGNAIGNMTEVFAYLTDQRTPIAFPKEKVGGMVAPDFGISSISRAFGPIGGDPKAFADGTFDPFDIFKGVMLLGGIDLGAILKLLKNATQNTASTAIPGLKNVRLTKPVWATFSKRLTTGRSTKNFSRATGIFKKKPGSTFSIHTVLDTPLNGAPPQFTVDSGLTNFAVTLLPTTDPSKPLELVGLNFDKVDFHAGSNKKLDFGIVFAGFEFLGPLRCGKVPWWAKRIVYADAIAVGRSTAQRFKKQLVPAAERRSLSAWLAKVLLEMSSQRCAVFSSRAWDN